MGWCIPKIWEGGDCYIIGGGPSMMGQFNIPEEIVQAVYNGATPQLYEPYLHILRDKHVIGVNVAYRLGDFIDFTFFGDVPFYLTHLHELVKLDHTLVTLSGKVNHLDYGIKVVDRDKPFGLSDDPTKIRWNRNSGSSAINLAVHLGAKRIMLLGFDMKLKDHKDQHWHKLYGKKPKKESQIQKTFIRHSEGFPKIARDAKRLGVEILNVNPDSAITAFERVNLSDVYSTQEKDYAVCVLKTGGDYTPEYVYKLRSMIKKNTKRKIHFRCLTDSTALKLAPEEVIPLRNNWPGWWSKIELFRHGIFPDSRQVVYFDLDTVILKSIDSLFKPFSGFRMLDNFRGSTFLMSGIMTWDCDLSFIYEKLRNKKAPRFSKAGGDLIGDQTFIEKTYKSATRKNPIKIQESLSVISYKRDFLMNDYKHNGAQVICFHGQPRPHEVNDTLIVEKWK